MTMPAESKRRYTIAEYLAFEASVPDKHELHDGEIVAMSGGSYRHSKIAGNLYYSVAKRLKKVPCEPLNSDMRISIPAQAKYFYPDLSVLCDPPEFDPRDRKKTTLINPKVIFEVLSESTERYDRGRKFSGYIQNPHIQECVLVSQDTPLVETFVRRREGNWLLNFSRGVSSRVKLASVEITLPLREIYEGIQFEASA